MVIKSQYTQSNGHHTSGLAVGFKVFEHCQSSYHSK